MLDATALDVDYNFDSKKISEKILKKKGSKMWFLEQVLPSIYGFKGTFLLDYNTMMPVLFIIHPGSPHDSQIFLEVLWINEKNTICYITMIKFSLTVDIIGYENCEIGLKKYNIQPLILIKSNFNIETSKQCINLSSRIFQIKQKG